ncbi:MAG: DNA primase, partial [Phycisphaerales bacterium]
SFNVSPVKQIFKCFACGAGGDVFKFVQMRENLSFVQAIERLAERAGIKLKPKRVARPAGSDSGPAAEQVDPNQLARVNAWATEYFRRNLQLPEEGKFARDYLAERQISPESVEKWRIGLALDSPDALHKAAAAKKIPSKLLAQAGLVTAQGQDKFINRLVFTITDPTGRVVGFGGRTLDRTGAKYVNSPTTPLFDKSNCLYGLDHARHEIVSSGTAVVVEGYTDVIAAHQTGCTNVVASLGTSFTPGHARILRRYASRVVLVFDSDVAGIEAANRALEICLSQAIDIKLASVPQGKDPCDFLLTAGKEPFQKLVDGAVDVFRFKWDRLLAGLASEETIAARKAALEEYLQAVAAALHSGALTPIEKGLRVNQIAAIIGLDKKDVETELARRLARTRRAASYNVENQQVRAVDLGAGLFAAAQRELIEVLLNRPDLLKLVEPPITPAVFDVPALKDMAEILFELRDRKLEFGAEPGSFLRSVLARAESADLGAAIVRLQAEGERKAKFEERLSDSLHAMTARLARRQTIGIKETADQNEFLKRLHETTGTKNPHNIGMV